ncbi:MAG: DUF4044 domain-containing protein [Streptococcaceae bacterium]|nr:DUF4044 domain-containing protein [Streptococcaceae bacterium]MCL2681230.1 DUF4044 domain-containing protein [Streptococcaceae bacterium]
MAYQKKEKSPFQKLVFIIVIIMLILIVGGAVFTALSYL